MPALPGPRYLERSNQGKNVQFLMSNSAPIDTLYPYDVHLKRASGGWRLLLTRFDNGLAGLDVCELVHRYS